MAPMSQQKVLFALGANVAGPWGAPAETLTRAVDALAAAGVENLTASRQIVTPAWGKTDQSDFVNAVAGGSVPAAMAPLALLAVVKAIERAAGRQPGERWGPRVLDIDILDFDGTVLGWDRPHDPAAPAELVLPHPLLHERPFVLVPLAEFAPTWRHPVLGETATELLARLAG